MSRELLDSTRLSGHIKTIVKAERKDTLNDQASKSAIDASYAGGPPKTIEAGAAGSYEHSICSSHLWMFPAASQEVVKQPIGDGEVLTGAIIEPPSGVLYNSGGYELFPSRYPENATTTVVNSSTTAVRGMRFLIGAPLLVAKVSFEVTGATASALAAIGIYSSDRGTLLINTGAVDCSSNGIKEVTLGSSYQLYPGWYWVMFTLNDTSTALRALAMGANIANLLNQGTVQRGTAANAAASAVLPATLGTITATAFNFPLCKLQQ